MQTNKKIVDMVFTSFVVLVALINGALTFMFGGTYGAETFPTTLPALSFLLGGLMLTIFYDGGALAWFLARGRDGQSNQQRAIATLLSVLSMGASVGVSAIQLMLTTTLVDLSPWHASIGILGLVVMIAMAGAHFVGLFAYRFSDPRHLEADAGSELEARLTQLRLEQREQVAAATVQRASELMMSMIGPLAKAEAEQVVAGLVAEIRPELTPAPPPTLEDPPPLPPPPTASRVIVAPGAPALPVGVPPGSEWVAVGEEGDAKKWQLVVPDGTRHQLKGSQ